MPYPQTKSVYYALETKQKKPKRLFNTEYEGDEKMLLFKFLIKETRSGSIFK